jgi:hypothetical protein
MATAGYVRNQLKKYGWRDNLAHDAEATWKTMKME